MKEEEEEEGEKESTCAKKEEEEEENLGRAEELLFRRLVVYPHYLARSHSFRLRASPQRRKWGEGGKEKAMLQKKWVRESCTAPQ